MASAQPIPRSVTGGAVGLAGSRNIVQGKIGLAIPLAANGRGGFARVSGERQLSKVILLNLMDLESDNPFQGDIGLGGDMVFAVADERLQQELRRRINALFRRLQLEDRARLVKPPTFTILSETQELDVNISYLNLEENKPEDVDIRFSTISSVDVASSFITALV